MALITLRELRELTKLHYIVELLLAISFFILKSLPITARCLFGDENREYSTVETEVLILILIVMTFTCRRRGHVDFLPYLSTACTVAKLGNFILFFMTSSLYAFVYTLVMIAHVLLLPKPKYKGPENITYFFRDDLEKEISASKCCWLIEFYASWNPACNEFAGVFSELSAKYATKDLKFGKVDLSRCPRLADHYKINVSVTSRELPTIILFIDGQVHTRRPLFDARGRVIPFSFSYENIINNLDLPRLSKGLKKSETNQIKKDK